MDIVEKIRKLKKEKNALIVAHYYQPYEIQELADIVGDSLELARKSKDADAELLVFCGVRFMAESAALLCPGKKVISPAPDAGCFMADTMGPEDIRALRAAHPGSAVVCYINSTAATKAECDICCTSSNALKVVNSLEEKDIIFVPDRNLGSYVAEQMPDRRFWFHEKGCCAIHDRLSAEKVAFCKANHPASLTLAHPECNKAVRDAADFVGSTAQIIKFCESSASKEFIICTELGVTQRMQHIMPDKTFYVPDSATLYCDGMKKITREKLLSSLENETEVVTVDEALREAALKPIERMLNI